MREKCADPRSYVVETAGCSMLRRNRCQLREATTLMTAVPVSSSNDNSSDDITTTTSVIATREGNEEAQKRVNTNGNRESEATEPTGGNAEPGSRTKSGRVVKIPARYLEYRDHLPAMGIIIPVSGPRLGCITHAHRVHKYQCQ